MSVRPPPGKCSRQLAVDFVERAEVRRNCPGLIVPEMPEDVALWPAFLLNHPALAAAHLSADAAHANGKHHAAWEAPEIGVEFYQAPVSSFPNPLKDQREIDYSVSQVIPFPGKLSAMSQSEHFRGAAEESRAGAVALDLRRQILSAYADLHMVEWRLRLLREDRAEVERLLRAARTGYEGGMGSQSDLLRVESEAAKLDADALQLESERFATLSALASLAGGEVSIPFVDNLAPPAINPSPDRLKALALQRRPDLEAIRYETGMAGADAKARDKDAYPDLMLRGAYKDMLLGDMLDGTRRGYWSVIASVKVPIAPWSWGGVRSGVTEARTLQRKSEQDYAAMRLSVNAEVDRAVAMLTSAQERMELEQNRRIPLAEQSLRSSLAAYQGGRSDFNGVLMAFRELRMAREDYHMAVADHLKAWADLEYASGGSIIGPALED